MPVKFWNGSSWELAKAVYYADSGLNWQKVCDPYKHVVDIDRTQADFQDGTLTDVEADAGDYLRLADTPVLSFDGTDDYVDCGSSTQLCTIGWTVSAWIKKPSFSDFENIVGTSKPDGTNYLRPGGYICVDTNGQLRDYDGTWLISNSSISLDIWHFVTFQLTTSGDYKFYIDGNLDKTITGVDTSSYSGNFYLEFVGRFSSAIERYFNGNISDVRIWNTARTQTEIQADMNNRLTGSETDLVAYYKLDEGTGTTATDSAGTNDGTLTNGPTWVANEPLYFMNPSEDNNRLSPQLDLSAVGTVESSSISWTETLNGETITIETRVSLDGGSTWTSWTAATDGGSIPGLNAGDDVSNGLLECRQTLSTSDPTITPQLSSLIVAVKTAN